MKQKLFKFFNSNYGLAILLAALVATPFIYYTYHNDRVIAPVNLLQNCCGWDYTPNEGTAENIIPSDVSDYILPSKFFLDRALELHSIPLWNPLYFGGEVFHANSQSAVFHPINISYAFTDTLTVQNFSVIGSFIAIVFFSFLYLRVVGLARFSSAVGSLAYASAPWVIFWSQWGTIVWVMASWPAILWALNKWKRSHKLSDLILISAILGLQFYFGHLQFSLMTLGIAIFWVLFYTWRKVFTHRNLKQVMAMLIAGFLIGAGSWLPSIEQASLGHRSNKTQDVNTTETINDDVKGIFSPIILSSGQDYYFDFSPPRPTLRSIEITRLLIFAGMILCVGALLNKKNKLIKPDNVELYFLMTLALVGIMAGWSLPPVGNIILSIPVIKGILPHYFIALTVFALPMLAAFSCNKLLEYRRSNSEKKFESLLIILSAILLIAILGLYVKELTNFFNSREATPATLFASFILLLAIFLNYYKSNTIFLRLIMAILIVIMTLNLFAFTYATVPMPEKRVYTTGSSLYECLLNDAQKTNIFFPRAISSYSPNTSLYYGVSVLNGYDSLFSRSTSEFIKAYNYPVQGRESTNANAVYVANNTKTVLGNNLGVNYLILKSSDTVPRGYTKICNTLDKSGSVYKSDIKNETIYFASAVERVSLMEQLDRIRLGNIKPREVMQDRVPVLNYMHSQQDLINYKIGINDIKISARSDSAKLIFIGQSFNKNWKAYIDGENTEIIRANYNFMAVEVPAGEHEIILKFEQRSFYIGAIISVATTSIISLLLINSRYKLVPSHKR